MPKKATTLSVKRFVWLTNVIVHVRVYNNINVFIFGFNSRSHYAYVTNIISNVEILQFVIIVSNVFVM